MWKMSTFLQYVQIIVKTWFALLNMREFFSRKRKIKNSVAYAIRKFTLVLIEEICSIASAYPFSKAVVKIFCMTWVFFQLFSSSLKQNKKKNKHKTNVKTKGYIFVKSSSPDNMKKPRTWAIFVQCSSFFLVYICRHSFFSSLHPSFGWQSLLM